MRRIVRLSSLILMFAIVDIAGFQEKVSEGDALQVPLLSGEPGDSVTFDSVFLLADGEKVTLGTPVVDGASVEAKIIEHGKGDKIRVFKMKRRKRYRRVQGHRQDYTNIEITKVKATGAKKAAAKVEKVEEKEEVAA